MAGEFSGFSIAVLIVTGAIILSGILIGLGRAFGFRKIEYFGYEELVQSIINAAMIGGASILVDFVATLSAQKDLPVDCGLTATDFHLCYLSSINSLLFQLFQNTSKILELIGYYQGLILHFGTFSISPFANLSALSNIFSLDLLFVNLLLLLSAINIQIALFLKDYALSFFFPLGLLLRTFFATRRLGGFLISLSIGLFVLYPSFILVFPNPSTSLSIAINSSLNVSNNSYYSFVPIVDLNNNNAIAAKLDIMSGRCSGNLSNSSCAEYWNSSKILNSTINMSINSTADFSNHLGNSSAETNVAISKSLLYLLIAPVFSLLISAVFIKELTNLLGAEFIMSIGKLI